jgi:hypothetical protein
MTTSLSEEPTIISSGVPYSEAVRDLMSLGHHMIGKIQDYEIWQWAEEKRLIGLYRRQWEDLCTLVDNFQNSNAYRLRETLDGN